MEKKELVVISPRDVGEFPRMTTDLLDGLVELSVKFEHAKDAILEESAKAVDAMNAKAAAVKRFRESLEADLEKNFKA